MGQLPGWLPGWRAGLIHLRPCSGETTAACTALPSHRILELRAGSPVAMRWTVPGSGVCAVFAGVGSPAVRLLGRPLHADDIMLAGPGTQIEILVPKGGVLIALMVASPRGIPRRTILLHEERRATGGDAPGLRHCLGPANRYRADIDLTVAETFRRAVATSRVIRGDGVPDTARISAVAAVCQLVDQRFPDLVSLGTLCRHAGVAERTLEYGFQQVYETTPLAFIRTHRLTRNRAALVRAGASASISDTARACGFTHMGQYTRDYRRLFGETPSATLARNRPINRQAAG